MYLNYVEGLQDIAQNFFQYDDVVRHGADSVPGNHGYSMKKSKARTPTLRAELFRIRRSHQSREATTAREYSPFVSWWHVFKVNVFTFHVNGGPS